MKPILVATTLILAGCLSGLAQSKFTVANPPSMPVTYFHPGHANHGQRVNSVGADKYWAQLYISPAGGDESSLAPVATAIAPIGVNDTVASGLFNFGTVTIHGLDAGATVLLQVRGWLGSNVSGGYDSAFVKGQNRARPFTAKINPPVVAFGAGGLDGFFIYISPEPGSSVLVGLGLGGLFFLRRCRRKYRLTAGDREKPAFPSTQRTAFPSTNTKA